MQPTFRTNPPTHDGNLRLVHAGLGLACSYTKHAAPYGWKCTKLTVQYTPCISHYKASTHNPRRRVRISWRPVVVSTQSTEALAVVTCCYHRHAGCWADFVGKVGTCGVWRVPCTSWRTRLNFGRGGYFCGLTAHVRSITRRSFLRASLSERKWSALLRLPFPLFVDEKVVRSRSHPKAGTCTVVSSCVSVPVNLTGRKREVRGPPDRYQLHRRWRGGAERLSQRRNEHEGIHRRARRSAKGSVPRLSRQ